jgi:hypothetical protein
MILHCTRGRYNAQLTRKRLVRAVGSNCMLGSSLQENFNDFLWLGDHRLPLGSPRLSHHSSRLTIILYTDHGCFRVLWVESSLSGPLAGFWNTVLDWFFLSWRFWPSRCLLREFPVMRWIYPEAQPFVVELENLDPTIDDLVQLPLASRASFFQRRWSRLVWLS